MRRVLGVRYTLSPKTAAWLISMVALLTAARWALPSELVLGRRLGRTTLTDSLRSYDAVAVDARGRAYVLDSRRGRIDVFDTLGAVLQSSGRPGTAEGEFTEARALAIDEAGSLFVLDPRAQRLSHYTTRDSLRLVRSAHVELNASGMCAMEGALYLFALHENNILHRLRFPSTHSRSFGVPFGPAESPLAQMSLSAGSVLCIPAERTVIVVPNVVPEIRAYNVDGELLWSRILTRYSATLVSVVGAGVSLRSPDAGYHQARAAFAVSNEVFALQLELRRDRRVIARDTRLLSIRTGDELGNSTSLPQFLTARSPLIYALDTGSVRRLEIYRYAIQSGPQ